MDRHNYCQKTNTKCVSDSNSNEADATFPCPEQIHSEHAYAASSNLDSTAKEHVTSASENYYESIHSDHYYFKHTKKGSEKHTQC